MKRSDILKNSMIVLLSLGSLGIVGGIFFLKQVNSNTSQTQATTNTSRYWEIRHKLWSNLDLVKHFPLSIPADATNVHIAYSGGISPGNTFFQLRLKQPPEKIQKLLLQYSNIAKFKYQGGNTNDHANQIKGVPTTFFYTSQKSEESFPATSQILVINAENKGTPGFKWNHGNSYGVAVDTSTSEVVYWAEQW